MAKCIVILGMHRSATSLIAKGVFKAGAKIGNYVLSADENNPNGYWEDMSFLRLNRKILKAAGGDWRHVPPRNKILALKEFTSDIKKLVQERQAMNKLWTWKDPRTTLTIELYEPFLKNVIYVPCFRNPIEVAKSLYTAQDVPFKEGIALTYEYNRRLLNFLNKRFLL